MGYWDTLLFSSRNRRAINPRVASHETTKQLAMKLLENKERAGGGKIENNGISKNVYGQHFQQSMDRPGMVANPPRGRLKRETAFINLVPVRA